MKAAWLTVVVAACSNGKRSEPAPAAATRPVDAAVAPVPDVPVAEPVLPPAPPVPAVPLGLPPVEPEPAVTPENVALGELLFFDRRIGRDAQGACADCHEPAHGWGDRERRSPTLAGKPNLRHAPALVNLAWVPAYGWDGRFPTLPDAIRAHWKGQLDIDPAEAIAAIEVIPAYRAHFRRAAHDEPGVDAALIALAAFVRTRYDGDAPWDRAERGGDGGGMDAQAGYRLFTGKAQCSTCHVPPLYTDQAYHRLGLIESRDEGRGRVDRAQAGAFRTPTLRGAVHHPPYFHDGSAATLEAAIRWHLDGGTGQGARRDAIDPALVPVTLTADEARQLRAFVEALTSPAHAAPAPELP